VVAYIFETWDNVDAYFLEYIDNDSKELRAINVMLKSINERAEQDEDEEDNRYTVVTAPFGIEKTSLAIYCNNLYIQIYRRRRRRFNQ
jgi:hypothetical protein